MQEGDDLIGGDDKQSIGLDLGGGELGDELRRCDTHAAGDALLVVDARTDELGDGGGRAEAAERTGDIEEGLIETQWLDQRGDGGEDRHDPGADLGVALVMRLDDDGIGCGAARTGHGHRGMHAHGAGLVGR